MATPSDPTQRSARTLSALIGFLVLFAAVIAGGTLVNAGREKLHDPAWTGAQSGMALTGFLQGAKFKATKTERNPYPDVLAPVQTLNTAFIAGHARLFSWLTTLGELCLPIGMLILLCVRFPGSRYTALIVSMLATSLHVVFLLEGSSGMNPPLLLMWLTVVWLLATMPAAALHHAVDLGALIGKRTGETPLAVDTSIGQWAFFGTVALVIGGGGAVSAADSDEGAVERSVRAGVDRLGPIGIKRSGIAAGGRTSPRDPLLWVPRRSAPLSSSGKGKHETLRASQNPSLDAYGGWA